MTIVKVDSTGYRQHTKGTEYRGGGIRNDTIEGQVVQFDWRENAGSVTMTTLKLGNQTRKGRQHVFFKLRFT